MKRKTLCVFAGSNSGSQRDAGNGGASAYTKAAQALGEELARRGIGLVYGGARVGLMGAVADAALAGGGAVTGVLPEFLANTELTHPNLTQLRIVDTMQQRKALMATLSDGFIALPGGLGTFDELLEALTGGQLGLHDKPCAALNVQGYFDPLLSLLAHAARERFLKPAHRDMLIVDTAPGPLLEAMARYQAPRDGKWLGDSSSKIRS